MIYLDNSATTKPYKEVIEAYTTVAASYFGNPSSLHTLGMNAENLVEESRGRIAQLMNVKANELVFTSSGTEGNNMAIKGTAYARRSRGNHLITTSIEHASVIEAFRQLEKEGFEVTYLPVDRSGRIKAEQVEKAIRSATVLVSVGHVNSEVGTIQPIEEIGSLLSRYPTIYFHVDHVQGLSKVPLSIKEAKVDLCTCSAHKFHGLKGTGFLYVRQGIQLVPLLQGGSQEHGLRAGTENTAGIVAMTKALRLSMEQKKHRLPALATLREFLVRALLTIEGVEINSPAENVAPHIVNFSVAGVKPEVLVQSLSAKKIYISTKSACSSKLSEPSQVLTAMDLGVERASSGLRISLSFDTTKEQIEYFLKESKQVIPQLLEVVKK